MSWLTAPVLPWRCRSKVSPPNGITVDVVMADQHLVETSCTCWHSWRFRRTARPQAEKVCWAFGDNWPSLRKAKKKQQHPSLGNEASSELHAGRKVWSGAAVGGRSLPVVSSGPHAESHSGAGCTAVPCLRDTMPIIQSWPKVLSILHFHKVCGWRF